MPTWAERFAELLAEATPGDLAEAVEKLQGVFVDEPVPLPDEDPATRSLAVVAPEVWMAPGKRTVTVKSKGIPSATVVVFRDTAPNFPWYGASLKTVTLIDGDNPVEVQLFGAGDRVKVFTADPRLEKDTPPAEQDPSKPVQPAPGATTPAKAIQARLGLGINQERSTVTAHAGARQGAYYDYYRNLGMTHVRLFVPWRPRGVGGKGWKVDSSPAGIAPWLDAAAAVASRGMVAFFEACDVLEEWDGFGTGSDMAGIDRHVAMFAAECAKRNFPVDRVVIGAVNEYADVPNKAGNKIWETSRLRWHAALRKALPNHCILEGCSHWKHPQALWNPARFGEYVPAKDPNVIQDICHHYDASTPQKFGEMASYVRKWGADRDIPVLAGEWGFGGGDDGNGHVGRWVNHLNNVPKGDWSHLGPTLWCVTDGSAWRMNARTGSNVFHGTLEAAVRTHAAAIKKARGLA